MTRHSALPVLVLVLLSAILSPLAAQEQPTATKDTAADQAAVVSLVTNLVTAMNKSDSEGLAALLHDCVLMVYDESAAGPDGATGSLDKKMLLEMVAAGAVAAAGVEVDIANDDVDVTGDVAFVRGRERDRLGAAGDWQTLFGVAARQEGKWRLALIAIGMLEQGKLPDAAETIVADIETDDPAGLQAALAYLADGPVMALVGGPGFLVPMFGREQIETTVKAWEPPKDVKTVGERVSYTSPRAAVVIFDSQFANAQATLSAHNLLVLSKADGKWAVTAFVAALAPVEPK